MMKPELSKDFDVEDIWKLREYNPNSKEKSVRGRSALYFFLYRYWSILQVPKKDLNDIVCELTEILLSSKMVQKIW